MTLESDFHMLGGIGEGSYATNSSMQKLIASDAMFIVKEALEMLVSATPPSKKQLVFADLGCSTGTNAFVMFSEVLDTISVMFNKLGRPLPEIQLLLNDLPGNDFNALLGPVLSSYKESFTDSIPFYMAAVPGSFYERLFLKRSVHFIYSNMSLHWLSQVPMGLINTTDGHIHKTSIWICKGSPLVLKLYLEQFQNDFSSFLKHRSEELCSEGSMALIFAVRTSADPSDIKHLAWTSWYCDVLYKLASQDIVKSSDVDSFYIPMYFPSMEEVKSIIQTEGSFEVIQCKVRDVYLGDDVSMDTASDDTEGNWKKIEKKHRSFLEPLLVSHFGDSIIDPLFSTLRKVYEMKILELAHESFTYIAVSLKKK